jgi:hypothetical protein
MDSFTFYQIEVSGNIPGSVVFTDGIHWLNSSKLKDAQNGNVYKTLGT